MTNQQLALYFGFALVALAATHAKAQPATNCAPRDVVVSRLGSSYGETRRSIGLGNNNSVVEVFASDTTGSWTITVTRVDGITCLVASGQAFDTLDDALPSKTDDA